MTIEKKYVDRINKKLINEKGDLLSFKNDYGENKIIIRGLMLMKKVKLLVLYDSNKKSFSVKMTFKGF